MTNTTNKYYSAATPITINIINELSKRFLFYFIVIRTLNTRSILLMNFKGSMHDC